MLRSIRLGTLVLLAGFAVQGWATADTLHLRDGTILEGVATNYDSNTEILSWKTEEGREREIQLETLEPKSAYRVLKSEAPKDDGRGQLQLGNFARDIGLYAWGARHYEYAEKADPSLSDEIEKEKKQLRSEAAAWGMERAQESIEKGDFVNAEKWLRKIIIMLPDVQQATRARSMIDDYYHRVRAERTAGFEAKAKEDLKKGLRDAKEAYEHMVELNQQALTNSGASSRAHQSWESAVRYGEKSLREIETYRERHPDADGELLDQYRSAVEEQLSEVHINLASDLAAQTSYNQAMDHVNAVLAMNSDDEAAKSMRNRIIDAKSNGLGWPWGPVWR